MSRKENLKRLLTALENSKEDIKIIKGDVNGLPVSVGENIITRCGNISCFLDKMIKEVKITLS